MNLDLYQLRAFFTVAQTLNFTSAAKKLFVTQSAVSHAVKKLGRSAGEELFRKTGSGLALTETGTILYKACETIFYELERTETLLAGNRDRSAGIIRLGATVEFGTTLLVKYLRDFIRDNPKIHIDFQFKHDLLKSLLNDELDIIIDCKDHKVEGIEKKPLFREEYAVIASSDFLKENRIKTPADLARCNILSLDKAGTWWGNFLNALPRAKRPEFRTVTEMNHIRGIINAATESLGAGFVPKYCVLKELKAGTLTDVFPRLRLLEDYFYVYQKTKRAGFERHKVLIEHLANIRTAQLPRA
ncbi:MAG TPA: LysR family transcriptional regulator [Elusimicrobiales bacterium]|nr:LysR family transcriptional regulator [Elusimicrobiales bacterium]